MDSTKQALLKQLLSQPGQAFSGQSLADSLGVSRAAVNKAANELKKQGWQISAASGRGYSLIPGSDALTVDAVRLGLPADHQLTDIQVYPIVDSTNNMLRQQASQGAPHGTLIVAGEQTGGKGRRGRSFVSAPGKGIYFSLLLRPRLESSRAVAVTGSAAVAVRRAVKRLCGLDLSIKWVNDLYLNGKKVCGILTEASTDMETGLVDYLVVGIGINICNTPEDFGPELSKIATSLYPCGTSPVSRAAIAGAVAAELAAMCPEFDYLEEYRAACFVPGHWVTVQAAGQEPYTAKALSIDDEGRLVVELPNGRQTALGYGEISIRPANL